MWRVHKPVATSSHMFYGPTEGYFARTWQFNDFEPLGR
jgi:hypothetical protein